MRPRERKAAAPGALYAPRLRHVAVRGISRSTRAQHETDGKHSARTVIHRTTVNVRNNVLTAIGYVNNGLCGLDLHAHDKGLVDLDFPVNLVLEKEVP